MSTRILTGTATDIIGIPDGTRVLVYVFDTGEVEVSFREPGGARWGPPVQLAEEPGD